MKVFLSWSGPTSKAVAEALRDWLPFVLIGAEPETANVDVGAGEHWNSEIGHQLDNTSIGVICLTPSNFKSPWLQFEVGAICKSVGDSRVILYLFNLHPSDLEGPLAQFLAVTATQDRTEKLFRTIISAKMGARRGPNDNELMRFKKWWGDLRKNLELVPSDTSARQTRASKSLKTTVARSHQVARIDEYLTGRQIRIVSNAELGQGIRLGGLYSNEPLQIASTDWMDYGKQGTVMSGWTFVPSKSGLALAVAFFKIHLNADGLGYIQVLDAAKPEHTIWLETATGFRQEERFCWDQTEHIQRTALWDFTWKKPSRTRERALKVFLCHSSADKPAVRELYKRLQLKHIHPWLDEEMLLPGQKWREEIPRSVRRSDVVIVCLSPEAITKTGYVQKEIKLALDVADEQPEGAIFLIPLKLEECEVPDRLKDWQWVNYFEKQGFDHLMRALRLRAENLGIKI